MIEDEVIYFTRGTAPISMFFDVQDIRGYATQGGEEVSLSLEYRGWGY